MLVGDDMHSLRWIAVDYDSVLAIYFWRPEVFSYYPTQNVSEICSQESLPRYIGPCHTCVLFRWGASKSTKPRHQSECVVLRWLMHVPRSVATAFFASTAAFCLSSLYFCWFLPAPEIWNRLACSAFSWHWWNLLACWVAQTTRHALVNNPVKSIWRMVNILRSYEQYQSGLS